MKFWRQMAVVGLLMLSGGCGHGATVAERLKEYGPAVDARLAPLFAAKKISYPPEKLVLLGLKQERMLEVYAMGPGTNWVCVTQYKVRGASGTLGPKLREGDLQVPEGIYRVESLNPNSRFHLSLRIGYPNDFDRRQARAEKRTNLGGDIMIHGGAASVGCLAMGDEAAEDLFVLAAKTGLPKITMILSPVDFRVRELPAKRLALPKWTDKLYREIQDVLRCLPEGT